MNGLIRLPEVSTRTKILKYLLGQDLTAIDLGDRLDINESAVRRHLNNLENQSLVDHYFKKVKKGRPKKYYSLTTEGEDLFPKKSGLLLSIVMKKIKERYGDEELNELMDSVADELRDRIVADLGGKKGVEALKQIVKDFQEFGSYCELYEENGAFVIRYKNCVFREISPDLSEFMCRMHRKMIEDALPGMKIEQERSILSGDDSCVQRIEI